MLVCHQSYTNKINHIRKELPPEEQFRHENFVPAIMDKLDQIIYDELLVIRNHAQESFKRIDAKLTMWQKNKSLTQNNLEQLKKELAQRKDDQQAILLERLRDKERADIYTEMLEKCESDIERL